MSVSGGWRRNLLVVSLVAAACGPSLNVLGDPESGAQSGGGDGSTGGAATDSISVPPNPSTTAASTTTGDSATFGDVDDTTVGDDSDSGDDTAFIVSADGMCSAPPGYAAHCAFECNVWEQDCPRGEKCVPWANDGGGSWNAARCTEVASTPAAVGEPCVVEGSAVSGIDDCEFGAMCFYVDQETETGTCVSMCTGEVFDPVCPDGTGCSISNEGVLILCLPTCDPLGDPCPDAQVCAPVSEDFWCVPSIGEASYGEACDQFGECASGLACLDATVSGCAEPNSCCAAFCDLNAVDPDAACPDVELGQVCTPWFFEGKEPPGLDDLGVCAVPS
ncbi:MAG: ribulose phosphate epimerase [Nannocystaceae bacterium]|nr:ribulose phosphate epimerase [Nannocystaceae bacterium]